MLKLKSKFLLIVCAFSCCAQTFCATQPVSAVQPGDVVMQLQPVEQEIELTPGQHYTGTVSVQNIGRLAFSIQLSVKPYQVLSENYDPDFSTENSYTQLHNWITFPETRYVLQPGEKLAIPFLVDVPLDVPGGGQYAAIIVETRDGIDENATLKVVSQLASLLYAHVAGEEHIGGVLMAHSLPGFLLGSSFTSSMTVKNDGNVDFRATQTLTIHDFFTNRQVFSADSVDEKGQHIGKSSPVILPATSRTNRLTWPGAPQLGVFRATQTISFLDQNYTFTRIVIICPLWLVGIVLFLLFWMFVWLIARHHRRKKQKKQQLPL